LINSSRYQEGKVVVLFKSLTLQHNVPLRVVVVMMVVGFTTTYAISAYRH